MTVFHKNDIVIAKNEFLADYEKPKDTVGVVLDYNPNTDYLLLGVLRPEKYGIAPTFSMRGEYYRRITDNERIKYVI